MKTLKRALCACLCASLISCGGSQWAFAPKTSHNAGNSLTQNQARDEFETGAYREKDPSGMWIIAVIAGAAIVGSAILVPLYVNDQL